MPLARRSLTALGVVLAALVALPAVALAAEPVTVTGTVVRDGAPVTAVDVTVTVAGSDVVASTSTDEAGGFTVEVEAAVGGELQIRATGPTSRSDPDSRGCVNTETLVGSAHATIESLPPAPVTVDLDTVLTSTVCSATATPRLTPPATDAPAGARSVESPGAAWLLAVGVLVATCVGGLALARTHMGSRTRS